MSPASRASSFAPIVALALSCAGCSVVQSRAWNLEQLHGSDSSHRYSAALEGHIEWVFRHRIATLFEATGASLAKKEPESIVAPGDECLENLLALCESESSDPSVRALQIEWCARLAGEDPWSLTRERSVLALAKLGQRTRAGLPSKLGSDLTAAIAEDLAPRIEALVAAVRAAIERGSPSDDPSPEMTAACAAIKALDLDLAGARRALKVAAGLSVSRGSDDKRFAPLRALVEDLERLCIRRALASALDDRAPIVRAAAIESVVTVGGRAALDALALERLKREDDPRVLVAILRTVARAGLPDAANGAAARDAWLDAIYALVVQRSEGEVRVAAMRALEALTHAGMRSLREEDWQTWNIARVAARSSGEAARP